MAINLSRNTRLFVSTDGAAGAGSKANTNTFEVPVLDGYSFTQEAESQTITLNEAGAAPVRGQKIFNTAINPADISFATYARPYYATSESKHGALEQVLWEALVGAGTPGTANDSSANGTNAKSGANYMEANFEASNEHELTTIFFFFKIDNTAYKLSGVTLTTAEIDFSIDAIAQINWSAQATTVEELSGADLTAFNAWVDAGSVYDNIQTLHLDTTRPAFIKNKLSTMTLKSTSGSNAATEGSQTVTLDSGAAGLNDAAGLSAQTYYININIDGAGASDVPITGAASDTVGDVLAKLNYALDGVTVSLDTAGDIKVTSQSAGTGSTIAIVEYSTPADDIFYAMGGDASATFNSATAGTGTGKIYNVPITGGSLTIENNITFLTPEELGVVNQSIGSFTGTRAISGTVTAYLNSGSNNTGGLLADLVSDTTTVTHDFEMVMSMGGPNVPKVEFIMNNAHLVIPSINVEDVISTEINFTALGTEITDADELYVRYYAPTS